MTAVLSDIASFLRWWRDTLVGLLPGSLRARWHLVRERIELTVSEDQFSIDVVTLEGRRTHKTLPSDFNDAVILAETLEAVRGKDRSLVLRLPRHSALVRDLSLPLAAEENLRQVLQYEMDKYTPYAASAVYFGFVQTGRDMAKQRLHVRLVVIPRSVLDHWLGVFREWGVSFDRVEAEQQPDVDLLAAAGQQPASRSGSPLRWFMRFVVVLLVVSALIMPLFKMRQVVVELNGAIDQVQPMAARAVGLQKQRDRLASQVSFLAEKRDSRYPALIIMEELATVLADDTWVNSVHVKDGKITIQGFSESASDLIRKIDASALFESVSFIAPVTRDRRRNKDVFRIQMTISRKEPG